MQIKHINCNCYTARNSIGSDQHKSIKLNIFRNFLCWAFTYCTWCPASLSDPTSSSDILQTCQSQNLLRHPERFLQNKNMTILTFKKIVGKIGPQIGNARQGKKLWVKLVLTHTMHGAMCLILILISWNWPSPTLPSCPPSPLERGLLAWRIARWNILLSLLYFIVTWFLHFRLQFFSRRKGNKKDCHLQQDSIKLAFIIQNAKSSLGFHN